MDWKVGVNRALERALGLNLVRAGAATKLAVRPTSVPPVRTVDQVPDEMVRAAEHPATDRLLKEPVFIISTVRSGSTLLRVLLNAHPEILAPHELHIRRLRVRPTNTMAKKSMDLLGLNEADLEHLLWDRVLQRELQLSGKSILVDKTPSNSWAVARLRTVWPDARFIFLMRDPTSIAQSWVEVNAHKWSRREAIGDSLRYMKALQRAREKVPGLTVRYEDLTEDPAMVTQKICDFLGVAWHEGMLDYGRHTNEFVKGVGDWSEAIHSGRVQAGRDRPTTPDEVPQRLRAMSRLWGYLPPLDDESEPHNEGRDRRSEAEGQRDDDETDEPAR